MHRGEPDGISSTVLPGLRPSLRDPSGSLDRDSCQGFSGARRRGGQV